MQYIKTDPRTGNHLFRRPDGGCPLKNKKGVHIAAPMKSGMTRLTNLASSAHCREKAHRGRSYPDSVGASNGYFAA